MPLNAVNEDNHAFDFDIHTSDYDFQENFCKWYRRKNNNSSTVCLVGIRTQESLNRWRAIHSNRNINKFDSNEWILDNQDGTYNAYPIYDWLTEDIWTANAKFNWEYNRLYDLYYMAGVPVDKMRVASPFLSYASESLSLYRAIDPDNWGKMVGRVNGANFTSIYGGTHAFGWKNIKLPEGHSWESYMYFLLSTLPEDTRKNYIDKLTTSIKFWREKGGVLSKETIEKLKSKGIKIEIGESTNYKTEKLPVRMDYLDDIDISEFQEIPTYKRMCICIMKNDHLCKYMGFSQTKNELLKRKNIMEKYKALL